MMIQRLLILLFIVLLQFGCVASMSEAVILVTPPGGTCAADARFVTRPPVAGADYCFQSTDSTVNKWTGSAWANMITAPVLSLTFADIGGVATFAQLPTSLQIGLDITDYGAASGAAAGVNAAAFQAAHDASPAAGGRIRIPRAAACYSIDAQINVTKAIEWWGDGAGRVDAIGTSGSCVRLTNTTQNGFAVNTNEPVIFRDFAIVSTVAVSGAGIRLTAPGPVADLSGTQKGRIENMMFKGLGTCVKSVNAIFTTYDKNVCWDVKAIGVEWENQGNPDQNGPSITNSIFYDGTFTASGIVWRSGGGLRVMNNVILGFAEGIGVRPNFSGITTQEFWMVDNAITSFSTNGIAFIRASGTANLLYVHIKGNTIAKLGTPTAGEALGINITTNDATWLTDVQITGNFIADVDRGIVLGGGTRYRIADNDFLRITTGAAIGIELGGVAAQVQIGPNRFTAVTTTIIDSAASIEPYALTNRLVVMSPGGAAYPLTFPASLPGAPQCLRLDAAGLLSTSGSDCVDLAGSPVFTGVVAITPTINTEQALAITGIAAGADGGNLKLVHAGEAIPNKYIRSRVGNLEFMNSAYTAVLFTMNDTGGIVTGAAAGLSVTKTVRAAGGAADCTLIFTNGWLTGGTC